MSGWDWMDAPQERDQHDAWVQARMDDAVERQALETEEWVHDQMEALRDRSAVDPEWEDLQRRIDAGEYDTDLYPGDDEDYELPDEFKPYFSDEPLPSGLRQNICFPESPLPAVMEQLAVERQQADGVQGDAR